MPRPRKPIEHHLGSGHYRPSRHGPKPTGAEANVPPAKPDGLDDLASALWDRLVRMLAGVVRDRDAVVLEQLVRWWSRWQEVEKVLEKAKPGQKGYTALLTQSGICSDKVDRLAARFGLTPADRAKLRPEAPTVATRAEVRTRPPTKLDREGPPKKSPPKRKGK